MALPGLYVDFGFGQFIGTAKGSVTWTDVTDYVRAADGMSFGRGRTAVGQAPSAGTFTVSLANDDGRFTPGRAGGPYGTGVQARIPVRVRAGVDTDGDGDDRDVTREYSDEYGDEYGEAGATMYDLWYGFVTDINWNPGADVKAHIQAADILGQATKITCKPWLTGRNLAQAPSYYWPLTDTAGAAQAETPVTGTPPLAVDDPNSTSTATLTFGVESDASPDPETVVAITSATSIPGRRMTAPVTSPGTVLGFSLWVRPTGVNDHGELFSVTATRYKGDTTAQSFVRAVLAGGPSEPGDYGQIVVYEGNYGGETSGIYGEQVGTTTGDPRSFVADEWKHLYVRRDGAATGSWATRFRVWLDGVELTLDTSGTVTAETFTTSTPGIITVGQFAGSIGYTGQLGHMAVFNSSSTTVPVLLANNGSTSPTAAARFEDLANVTGQPAAMLSWMTADTTADITISQQPTGAQTLATLGQQVAATERGNLIATRDGFLRLMSSRSRLTETVALTLDASTDVLSFDGAFAIDDADAVDEVTVTAQPGGATYTGTRSGGASLESTTAEVWSSDAVHAQAVADGSANYPVDVPKSPKLSVSMAWMTHAGLADDVLALELGDLIRVTDLPASAPDTTVDLVVEAINHETGTGDWVVTFDTSPGELAAGGVVGTTGTLSTVATTLVVRP
jgi:hypothetical protein